MRNTVLILMLAASAAAASAQAPAKPATAPAKTATASKPAAKPATATAKAEISADKLPAGVTAIAGPKTTVYTVSLRYQDEKIGTGEVAAPGKMVKCLFTIWTAGANGFKIDSSDDHRMPALDKDHKPVMGDDGKPKLGDPQPAALILGRGQPFPGWDQGLEGMKVNGKRRVFIPWQLGLGDREVPARDATHQPIPPKSDLILDLELTEVAEAPKPPAPGMPPNHPPMNAPGASMQPGPGMKPMAPMAPPAAPSTPAPAAAPAPAAPAPAPAAPSTPAQPQSK